jgi:hypothetical protein
MGTTISLLRLLERGLDKTAFFFLAVAVFRYLDEPIPSFEGSIVLMVIFVVASLVILFIRCALETIRSRGSKEKEAA